MNVNTANMDVFSDQKPADVIPERWLWQAVLCQAVEDWDRPKISDPNARARCRAATRTWFASDKYIAGSFLWVADMLDLDPDVIRAYLVSEKRHRQDNTELKYVLYNFRRERRISQQAMGRLIGTSTATISNIENGRSLVGRKNIRERLWIFMANTSACSWPETAWKSGSEI